MYDVVRLFSLWFGGVFDGLVLNVCLGFVLPTIMNAAAAAATGVVVVFVVVVVGSGGGGGGGLIRSCIFFCSFVWVPSPMIPQVPSSQTCGRLRAVARAAPAAALRRATGLRSLSELEPPETRL